ncbi:MAG: septum formation initiator family protein [Flavobacteriaceae bacterium]|jgi:cell division protein DivIC|nr:septum formation initiator family protein [Flavobacteriaceae bacterium]|tara:strand:+ start:41 stop:358 length:318 start_codon:yes stop_codon:yes gene_type:complete
MKEFIKKLISLFNKSYFKYLLILGAFIFWMTFLDTNSILIHAELNREIKKLKKRKDALTEEINKDQTLIRKLEDIDSLEHYGREKYNLKKDNEDIFIIEYESDKE